MPKLTAELRCVDLMRNLERRNKDSSSKKQVLLDRLQQLLVEDGKVPEKFEPELSEL